MPIENGARCSPRTLSAEAFSGGREYTFVAKNLHERIADAFRVFISIDSYGSSLRYFRRCPVCRPDHAGDRCERFLDGGAIDVAMGHHTHIVSIGRGAQHAMVSDGRGGFVGRFAGGPDVEDHTVRGDFLRIY